MQSKVKDLFLRDHHGRLKQSHIIPAPVKSIIATGEAVSSLKEIYSSQMNSALGQHESYHDPFMISSDHPTASPRSRSFSDSPHFSHLGARLDCSLFLKEGYIHSGYLLKGQESKIKVVCK